MGGRLRSTIALVLTLAILGTMFLPGPLAEVGRPLVLGGLVVLGAVVVTVARNRLAATTADERTGGTVWDAIPGWQYTGRHAESGGLTRDEQEQALRDIQEEAARRRR